MKALVDQIDEAVDDEFDDAGIALNKLKEVLAEDNSVATLPAWRLING